MFPTNTQQLIAVPQTLEIMTWVVDSCFN